MARRGRKKFWLINPPASRKANVTRRRRRTTTVAAKRKRRKMPAHVRRAGGWKAYMASIRPGGRRRRNVAKSNPRRRRRRSSSRRRRNPGTALVLANPRRRRRRNPNLSAGAVMQRVQNAALGATYVTVGKAVSRLVRDQTVGPEQAGKALGSLVEIGTGVLAGMAVGAVLPRRDRGWRQVDAGAMVAAGALQGVVEGLIKQFQVPVIADALGSDGTQYALVKTDGTLAGYVSQRQLANGLQGYAGRGGTNERARRPRSAFERQFGVRMA